MRNLFIDEGSSVLTITVPTKWLKSRIFRFMLKEYGRCLGRTANGWSFARAKVVVENTIPVLGWKLRGM